MAHCSSCILRQDMSKQEVVVNCYFNRHVQADHGRSTRPTLRTSYIYGPTQLIRGGSRHAGGCLLPWLSRDPPGAWPAANTCSAIAEADTSPFLRARQCSARQWSSVLPVCLMLYTTPLLLLWDRVSRMDQLLLESPNVMNPCREGGMFVQTRQCRRHLFQDAIAYTRTNKYPPGWQ